MRKLLTRLSLLSAAAALPFAAGQAATGTPQRGDKVPPGLAKLFEEGHHGILKAIEATEGSNSRLQDLPVSP